MLTNQIRRHFSKAQKIISSDVLIVGSGATGTALACALSQHNLGTHQKQKIIMLDHQPLPDMGTYDKPNRSPEPRVVTLSPNSLRMLASLGVMDIANAKYVTPFFDMVVTEEVGSSRLHFNSK